MLFSTFSSSHHNFNFIPSSGEMAAVKQKAIIYWPKFFYGKGSRQNFAQNTIGTSLIKKFRSLPRIDAWESEWRYRRKKYGIYRTERLNQPLLRHTVINLGQISDATAAKKHLITYESTMENYTILFVAVLIFILCMFRLTLTTPIIAPQSSSYEYGPREGVCKSSIFVSACTLRALFTLKSSK